MKAEFAFAVFVGILCSLGPGVSASVSCFFCKKLVNTLHSHVQHNSSLHTLGKVLQDACIVFGIEKKEVCTGLVKEFRPVIVGVLRDSTVDSASLCSELLTSSCGGGLISNWTVTVPGGKPPHVPLRLPMPGSPVMRAVHLADPHIDQFYKAGSKVDCHEPLCCRPWQGNGAAGKWGDVNCDPPIDILDNLFRHISETEPVDYVIWTGDLPAHDIWNQTHKDQVEVIRTISSMLEQFMPTADIYPAVGNHEASPVNTFAPPSVTGNLSDQWLLDILADTWQHWLPDTALATVRKGGYYSVRRPDRLRIVSLNFNYCNNLNLWLYVNDTDPSGQLQWLVQELHEAEAVGEKVHLIGHIPPGIPDCLPAWSAAFNKIVRRFESTVAAQFYGHTHFDELEVFFNSSEPQEFSRPASVAYIAPSVTTYKGHFPAYRIYDIDGGYENASWNVLDHHNYICNLTEANENGTPEWILEYSARSAYQMPSLFPRDWADFAKRCATNGTLFELYMKHKQHGPVPILCSDKKCHHTHVCDMLTSESGNKAHCSFLH